MYYRAAAGDFNRLLEEMNRAAVTLLLTAFLVAPVPVKAPGLFRSGIAPVESRPPGIDVERLADAIYLAEGGARAKKPYGIVSIPCGTEKECRRICLNTIRNNIARWNRVGSPGDFIDFLGAKYCPVGAANDPRGLNKNWTRNVREIYTKN